MEPTPTSLCPENVHAELIDGRFYDIAPPSRIHQEILGFLFNQITNYITARNGQCKVYPAPFTVELFRDKKTIVEPDISVVCDCCKLTEKGCCGAPDWIIEIISPGNPSHDYVRKLNLYADAGVREYWIVDPMGKEISVYFFEKSSFRALSYTFHDKIRSRISDDLWIDFAQLEI